MRLCVQKMQSCMSASASWKPAQGRTRRTPPALHLRQWWLDGTWERLHTALRETLQPRVGRQPQPSAGVLIRGPHATVDCKAAHLVRIMRPGSHVVRPADSPGGGADDYIPSTR